MSGADLATLPVRERKKALLRAAIIEAAERLFEERGYDDVTVADIADAANTSVKTLFVYFRSKEDLAFADTSLRDAVLAALARRPGSQTRAEAVGAALLSLLEHDGGAGIEGYHRGYGDSPALRTGLLRYWADLENSLTLRIGEELGETGPEARLEAMRLTAIVRLLTSPEARQAVAATPGHSDLQVRHLIDAAVRTHSPSSRSDPLF